MEYLQKIIQKTARVAIVGIGYVGWAVAQNTARVGYKTIGIDINSRRVQEINDEKKENFSATTDFSALENSDVVIICVPTPVTPGNEPDLTPLLLAVREITARLSIGQLILIESSIAPGTTRERLLPLIEKSGFSVGRDFYLAHSPERIDPGNPNFNMHNIPKVVGAIDHASLALTTAFYQQLVTTVVPVSSVETAELTKVLENTFRFINISFVNELLPFAEKIGVNLWEVIDAASTKPFGFLPHYPGPGIGGYCIPVLPYYLVASAKKKGVKLPIVEAAALVNETQPQKVAQKTIEILAKYHQNGTSHVLLVGIAYKKNLSDSRFSTSLKVWQELTKRGISVSYHDPYASRVNGHTSLPLTPETLSHHDICVITTAHSDIDYELLVNSGIPILDTRNVLKKYKREKIYRL